MMRRAVAVGTGISLLVGTVLVFRAFDAHSHSASDTLRPFVITLAPVWLAYVAALRMSAHAPAGAKRRKLGE